LCNLDVQVLAFFKAALMWHPGKIGWAPEPLLTISEGIPEEWYSREDLQRELKAYKRLAEEDPVEVGVDGGNCDKVWRWWVGHKRQLPAWFAMAKKLALIQPSSATVERLFSQLAHIIRSGDMLQDQCCAAAMLLFNRDPQ
jgi:hypothetical protein